LILAAAVGLAGCELDPVRDSDQISTRDLLLDLEASDEGEGGAVRIRLSGPFGSVRLAGGDALRLSMGGEGLPIVEEEEEGQTVYRTEPVGLTADLVIDLERPEDRSALGVVALVPPPFTLAAQGLTGGAPLELAWEGAEGEHTLGLAIEGECIAPVARSLAIDTGEYAVAQAELIHAGPGAAATCPLRVTLTRTASTQRPLVPGVEGGRLYAHVVQSRSVEVEWLP
jgi:hypothetical protein